jgi:hypothetical protein
MSSDIPLPTPDPHVEESWFQRPPVLATCALVIVLIGTVLWFVSRESGSASDTTVPTPFVSDSPGASNAPNTAVSPSDATAGPGPETTVSPVNPFGDVIGAIVSAPQSQAGRFAVAVDQRTPPAAVAALHSDAYYYALWAQLTSQQTAPGTGAVATGTGYVVDVAGASVELVDLGPANDLIRDGVEVRDGVATPLDVGIQSTGVCQPDREPQCDLSGSNFAPDSQNSVAQMWALAKVVIDPAADTWLLYVDLHGPRVVAARAESSISVGVDPVLNIVAVTYEKQPPPGTVLTLVTTADDGTTASFEFAVS